MRRLIVCFATAAFLSVGTGSLAKAPQLLCRTGSAAPTEPLVGSSDTARAIFLAIEARYAPHYDKVRFPSIEVIDEGRSWSLFRWSHPRTEANGDMIIEQGGGQLSMRIDKCDARISQVYFTR
jgi:hypothetical protein